MRFQGISKKRIVIFWSTKSFISLVQVLYGEQNKTRCATANRWTWFFIFIVTII